MKTTNKRKALLIQNLSSIVPVVRANSIRLLMDFPLVSDEEKLEHLSVMKGEQDSCVLAALKSALAQLNADSKAFFSGAYDPKPDASSSKQEMTPENNPFLKAAMENQASQGSMVKEADNPFLKAALTKTPLGALEEKPPIPIKPLTLPEVTPAQPAQPASQGQPFGMPPAQPASQGQPFGMPPAQPAQSALPPASSAIMASSQGLGAVAGSAKKINVDGELDPAWPPVETIHTEPQMLEFIDKLFHEKPQGYLTALSKLAISPYEDVALYALQILCGTKDSRLPSVILNMLKDMNYSSQRRFLMLKILMESQAPLNHKDLNEILLAEKDVIVKSGLVKVYARAAKQAGVETLKICLADSDPRVKANTIEVIESENIDGCDDIILNLLGDAEESRVRVNSAKYLFKKGYKEAFNSLQGMLASPELWLRDSVVYALGEIGTNSALILLKAALKDPNQGIRLSVLKALAKINSLQSKQLLGQVASDPDPMVAQVASSLFEKSKEQPDTPLAEEPKPIERKNVSQISQPKIQSASNPSVQLPPQQPAFNIPNAEPKPQPEKETSALPALSSSDLPEVNISDSSDGDSGADSDKTPSSVPFKLPVVDLSNLKPSSLSLEPKVPVKPQNKPPQPKIDFSKSFSSLDQRIKTSASAPPSLDHNMPELPAGAPHFDKPRSASIYLDLTSGTAEAQQKAANDMMFVMGEDQLHLLEVAVKHKNDAVRISAAKILVRRNTPEFSELAKKMLNDPNDTVKSMISKKKL